MSVQLGWHEEVLIELRRMRVEMTKMREAVERIAMPVETEHGDRLVFDPPRELNESELLQLRRGW